MWTGEWLSSKRLLLIELGTLDLFELLWNRISQTQGIGGME
jgi:hypothetical protein